VEKAFCLAETEKSMTDNAKIISSMMEELDRLGHIEAEDIPDIELYMDQVTSFMDQHLKNTSRKPDSDKILTKTMINNYAKNDLLPAPDRKKYSKEHMILMIFIYYYKGVLSMSDIQQILGPVTEKFFRTDRQPDLETIYSTVFGEEPGEIERIKKDVQDKYDRSRKLFCELKEDDRNKLQLFSFVCMMSYDVYIKKMLIERMIDGMADEGGENVKRRKSGET
jgi:hypothetical protein